MANEYATLAELKTALRITDSNDDVELAAKLTSAARRIYDDTGRRFYQDSGVTDRYYEIYHRELLQVNDISTLTGLVVSQGVGTSFSVIDSGGYITLPENSLADGKAIETIKRKFGYWPIETGMQIKVTARWGWPAIPEEIHNANVLLAARLFRRKDSPEGIKGFSDLGVVRVSKYDSDYNDLIGSSVRDVH